MNKILLSSLRMDWETPQEFYDKLNEEFQFTLDPCSTNENKKCGFNYTEEHDGLNQDWRDHRVFMNPPYGREIGKWVKKAYEESKKGALVVCLIPARTDTKWWWEYCMKGEIRFVKGRLKFKGIMKNGNIAKGNATFPSAVVIFKNA